MRRASPRRRRQAPGNGAARSASSPTTPSSWHAPSRSTASATALLRRSICGLQRAGSGAGGHLAKGAGQARIGRTTISSRPAEPPSRRSSWSPWWAGVGQHSDRQRVRVPDALASRRAAERDPDPAERRGPPPRAPSCAVSASVNEWSTNEQRRRVGAGNSARRSHRPGLHGIKAVLVDVSETSAEGKGGILRASALRRCSRNPCPR